MSPARIGRRAALRVLAGGASLVVLAACGASAQVASPPASSAAQAGAGSTSAGAAASAASGTSAKPAASASIAAPAKPASASAAAAAKPAVQPKSGGTLRIGNIGDLVRLDAHLHSGNTSVWFSYDRLTAYDEKLQPQPMLAESWDFRPDAKQLKLNLRKGVTFHDGRELTSDDVKYSIQRVANPKTGAGQMQPLAAWWSTIDTPDKYTAILTSDQPRPTTFDLFEYLNIVDKNLMEGPDAQTKVNGTGPFVFGEWKQGESVTFTKNKNYWLTGRPYLDGLAVTILRDQQGMVAQLEGGSLDIIANPPLNDYVRLKGDPKYQGIANNGTGGFYLIGANTTFAPLDNKVVRQALNYAIDRKRFVDTVLLGVSEAESLPWRQGSPAYEAAKQNFYTFDLDKAKSMLAQAGVSGLELDILLYLSTADYQGMAQIYQSDLAKIGVKLNIKTQDVGVWLDQVNNRKYHGLYSGPGAYAHLSPSTCFNSGKASNPNDNNSGYKSDTYSRLINSSATEPDASKQKALYSQLNDLFLDESFVMTLAPVLPVQVARAAVHGMAYTRHEDISHTETWMEG